MSRDEDFLTGIKSVLTRRIERVVHDEVIERFEKELKKRDDEHRKELKKRDEEKRSLSKNNAELVIRNANLVQEISLLKHQFRKDPKKSSNASSAIEAGVTGDATHVAPSGDELECDVAAATVPCVDYQHLAEKFNELSRLQNETTQRLHYQEGRNVAIMQKNHDMKESVKAWQAYSDRQRKRQRNELKSESKSALNTPRMLPSIEKDGFPVPPSSSPSNIGEKFSTSHHEHDRVSPILVMQAATVTPAEFASGTIALHSCVDAQTTFPEAEVEPQAGTELDEDHPISDHIVRATDVHVARGDRASTRDIPEMLPSSQATEDDIASERMVRPIQLVDHIDDDEPQFISERLLKRKRTDPSRASIYHERQSSDGTPFQPYRIKEEQLSSPSQPLTKENKLVRMETLDLDELGPNVIATPRRRLRRNESFHSGLVGSFRHERSTSMPPVKEERSIGLPRANPIQDGMAPMRVTSEVDTRALSEPTGSGRVPLSVLQPLDPNVVAVEQRQGVRSSKRKKQENESVLTKYQILTESGEEPPPVDEDDLRLTPNAARAKFNRRLQEKKPGQTPLKSALRNSVHTPTSALAARLIRGELPTPPSSADRPPKTPASRSDSRSGLGVDERVPSRMGPPGDARPSIRKVATQTQRREAPLRSKPVSELRLSDFKANPTYNQGYSYAFTETVRKRRDRACLPGCTKSECCGSTFRALAETLAPLPSSQEEALLEDYLGDAYDTMQLTQMSGEERKELVLQARTHRVANQYGRHRNAYERRASPPGFWRIDFPSTQEEEEDRQRAIIQEAKEVVERRREAMRKNGKWLFRDE